MTSGMETAWGHVPALRFTGYTSGEYLRLQYELKHREIPPTCVVELVGLPDRANWDEWFSVHIQVDNFADDIQLKPEDVILWLPHYVLHVRPTGAAFAYFPNGKMKCVVTEDMIS